MIFRPNTRIWIPVRQLPQKLFSRLSRLKTALNSLRRFLTPNPPILTLSKNPTLHVEHFSVVMRVTLPVFPSIYPFPLPFPAQMSHPPSPFHLPSLERISLPPPALPYRPRPIPSPTRPHRIKYLLHRIRLNRLIHNQIQFVRRVTQPFPPRKYPQTFFWTSKRWKVETAGVPCLRGLAPLPPDHPGPMLPNWY